MLPPAVIVSRSPLVAVAPQLVAFHGASLRCYGASRSPDDARARTAEVSRHLGSFLLWVLKASMQEITKYLILGTYSILQIHSS